MVKTGVGKRDLRRVQRPRRHSKPFRMPSSKRLSVIPGVHHRRPPRIPPRFPAMLVSSKDDVLVNHKSARPRDFLLKQRSSKTFAPSPMDVKAGFMLLRNPIDLGPGLLLNTRNQGAFANSQGIHVDRMDNSVAREIVQGPQVRRKIVARAPAGIGIYSLN